MLCFQFHGCYLTFHVPQYTMYCMFCFEFMVDILHFMLHNGPYAKFLNRAHLFFKKGAGDLIFTTCDCYGLNNVVFNFGAHS